MKSDMLVHERIFEEDEAEKSVIAEELYQSLMGQRANLIDQMVHDLYDEDARISGLERDLPEAVAKASAQDGGTGPSRLAMSMRRSVAEALQLISKTDKSFLVQLLSPVIGAATSQYFIDTTRHLIEQANQRLKIILSPKTVGWYFQSLFSKQTFGEILLENTTGYRVESIYTCEKLEFEPISQIDHSEEIRSLSIIRDYKSKEFQQVLSHLQEQRSLNKTINNVGLPLANNKAAVIYEGTSQVTIGIVEGNISHDFISLLQSISEELDVQYSKQIAKINLQPELLDHEIERLTEGMSEVLAKGLIEKKAKVDQNSKKCPKAILFPFILILLGLIFWQGSREMQWKKFVADLDAMPGITITQIDTSWGKRSIRGIKDPNATDPNAIAEFHGYKNGQVTMNFSPFLSGSDLFRNPRNAEVNSTIESVLENSATVFREELRMAKNSISPSIEESIQRSDSERIESIEALRAERINSVESLRSELGGISNSIDQSKSEVLDETNHLIAQAIVAHEMEMMEKSIKSLRQSLQLPNDVILRSNLGTLFIEGSLPSSTYDRVIELGAFVYSIEKVDSSKLINTTEGEIIRLKDALETIRVPFYSGISNPEPEATDLIEACLDFHSELKQLAVDSGQTVLITPRAIPLVGKQVEGNKAVVEARWDYLRNKLSDFGIADSEISDLQWDSKLERSSEGHCGLYLSVELR